MKERSLSGQSILHMHSVRMANNNTCNNDSEYEDGYLYLIFPDNPANEKVKIGWPPDPSLIYDANSVDATSKMSRQQDQTPLYARRSLLAGADVAVVVNEKDGAEADVDGQWQERFEQLVAFKAAYGHCNVPRRKGELGKWVRNQREKRRRRERGRKVSGIALADEREKQLTRIGFEWKPKGESVTWEQRFEELVEYKRVHGTCTVPVKKKELYRWTCEQRTTYRQKKKGRHSAMTVGRQEKLNGIGFEWKTK